MILSTLYAAQRGLHFKFAQGLNKSLPNVSDQKVLDLIKKHDLNDLMIVKTSKPITAETAGTSYYGFVISIGEDFEKLDNAIQSFILNHEIGHIKHEDPLFGVIAVTTALYICENYFSLFSFNSLATLITSIGLVSSFSETRADLFAIEHSSDEELKAIYCYHQAREEHELQKWNDAHSIALKAKHLFNGFCYHIFEGHPPDWLRKNRVLSELKKRGVKLEIGSQEKKLMNGVKDYLHSLDFKTQSKIDEALLNRSVHAIL